MSTIKFVLKKDKAKDMTKVPVYARITRHRKSNYISLGITVNEAHWDNKSQRVNLLHPNRIRMNATLGRISNDMERVILQDLDEKKNLSSKDIKDLILGKTQYTFTEYFRMKRDDLLKQENYSRYKKVKGIYNKLIEFSGERELSFQEINYSFLTRFEQWMKDEKNNKVNTIHTNLKYIRKLFNDAIRDGIIDRYLNPFQRYKLSTEKTQREYLSDTELEAFRALNVLPKDKEFDCHQMFILACYTGLRVSDLLTLRCNNYDGKHLTIQMRKTKESLSIAVPSVGRAILDRCIVGKREGDFVFPFLNSELEYSPVTLQKQIMSKTALCNAQLKTLAKKAGISKNLTFHISRHTFATRALRKGIRIEYVSKLLGHADIKTTQVYAKIVNKDLDAAMEVFG